MQRFFFFFVCFFLFLSNFTSMHDNGEKYQHDFSGISFVKIFSVLSVWLVQCPKIIQCYFQCQNFIVNFTDNNRSIFLSMLCNSLYVSNIHFLETLPFNFCMVKGKGRVAFKYHVRDIVIMLINMIIYIYLIGSPW